MSQGSDDGPRTSPISVMKRTAIACALLWIGTAPAETAERFMGATAESVLKSCREKDASQQSFCFGFIYALAVRLADTRQFCAYWPVSIEPLIAEAIDALAGADKNDHAWQVVEMRLIEKHLPPCK